MPITRLILFFIFSSAVSTNLFAQTGSIKGKLQDSLNKQDLPLATVTVFQSKDTALITYRLSDGKGDFKVPSLPLNEKLRVLISFSGFKVFRKEFILTTEKPLYDLGTIMLANDPKSLDEILVYAERPPVSVRQDTIEFNASAFKSLPSALLEDLLKKLPGVDIDLEGNVTVKGKKVNRLLVDGKEFFGGDPKIATKNLPANIVDKVQVMDDKEQLERDPDISPADLGQVVNIKLKRAIKEGWFGKAYAGAGTNSRHETGAIVNAFRDTTQVSFLGYSNNINKPGFGITDLQKIGGFNRSGGSDMIYTYDGGIFLGSTGGASFGGGGQGIQHSFGGGVNFNHVANKKVTFNLQYFYGQVNSDYETLSNRQRFFGDTTQVVRSSSTNSTSDRNHRIGGTVAWKIDSFTTITYRPGVTFNKNLGERYSYTLISNNVAGNLNEEDYNQNSISERKLYTHNIFLLKNFRKKKGRTLTVTQNLNHNNYLNDQYNDRIITFYVNPVTTNYSEMRQRETENYTNSFNATYMEPVSKTVSLRFQQATDWGKEKNHLTPYNKDISTGKFTELVDSIQSGIDRRQVRNVSSIGINWRRKKITLTSSVNMQWLDYKINYLRSSALDKHYFYVYPTINFRWKDITVNYSANINVPSSFDLQPIVDNTNRQYLYYGNPNLKPSFSSNISVSYYKYSPKGSAFNIYLSAQKRDNTVMRENIIDLSGIQTTRPVNISGLTNMNLSTSYTKQFNFNKKLKLSLRPSLFGGYSDNMLSNNGYRSNSHNKYLNGSMNISFNYKDKIELNQGYRMNLSQTKYDIQKYYRDIEVITHSLESEIVIRYPKQFVWESLINYSHNPNVASGIKKDAIRLNAGVNYLFLKQDKGQLKLSVFDLLDQSISVSRYASENSISDYQTTTLHRYFMLSFIYNIRTFVPGKVGGKERSFFLF